MAKKKKNQNPQLPQKTSSVESNLFMKGMVKDTFASIASKEVWEHAVNAINNSIDGDTGVIGNEPANFECAEIPYTIIGSIHIYGDQWAVYSTDNISSEIGVFDDSKCEYTRLINDPCLNFSTDNLIIGAAKENFECKWQLYWDDGLNPSRTIILDEPPYVQIITSAPGAACVVRENIQPLTLDCERIRLAPLIDTPCLDLQKAPEGGQLRNGSYQAFIAYTINDQVYGDYIGISNVQPLFDHDDTSGSLILTLSNLDTEFDQYQLVLLTDVVSEVKAYVVGNYSTEQTTIKLDYLNQALKSLPLDFLPLRRPAYEKSKGMFVVNDYLVRTQPTEQFDFNYQPLANQIQTNWVSVEYPVDYYYNGGNKPSFLRDEVYTFFIRFIYNTGERSSSYHIPGRASVPFNAGGIAVDERTVIGGDPNALDPTDPVFKVYNTAFPTSVNINQTQPDGGIIRTRGAMAYWESTELYPQDQIRYGGLCGQPIRHHKMPDDNSVPDGTTATSSPGGASIFNLAVEFTNIPWPRDNDGNLITNIVGYEFLVGTREGNKSILGKGILKNMEAYAPTETASGDGTTQFFIPNYPFNDLGADPYLRSPGNLGTPTDPTGTVSIQSWGTGMQNWLQGTDLGPHTGNFGGQINTFSNNVHTFHSPELMFNRPFLNAYELKSYGVLTGNAKGRFQKSEKHPGEKLLRNSTAILAAFIGIGYAMYEMRGPIDRKITTGQSYNMGQERGQAQTGNSTNIVMTPGNAFANGWSATANATSPSFNETTTARSGGQTGAAPHASGWAGGNGNWLTSGAITDRTNATGGTPGMGTGRTLGDAALIVGGGAFGSAAQAADQGAINLAQNTRWNTAGTIGPKAERIYKGSRFTQTPGIIGLLGGAQTFLNYVATGGQEIIDLIYNLCSFQDFAMKYNSHGWYRNMNQLPGGTVFRHSIDTARYLKGSISQLNANIRINNLNRPTTVAVNLDGAGLQNPAQLGFNDNSKFTIGTVPAGAGIADHTNPGSPSTTNIAAHYCAMKFNIDNQYGQLDSIRQIPMRGCVEFFADQLPTDASGNPIISTLTRFNTQQPLFGGDVYINRYTEKAIMPFFWDYLDDNERDGFVFDYRKYPNVPFPTYWMNTEQYRLDELTKAIGGMGWLFGGANTFQNAMPNDYYYLDRDLNALGTLGFFGATGGRGNLFHITEGFMYLHCNGVNDFFVESEINLAFRDWGEDMEKRHYDRLEYSDLTSLFHVDHIKKGNFYKYDKALSIDQFITRTTSFGNIQPRYYDPLVAETCYTTYEKRLIYSLQAKKEAKKDFWRVFLPLNYKEFKDTINTIKPISGYGAMVLFPRMSPKIFTGNDQLTTDAGTKITVGDGGLFVDRNFREVVNSDVSHEYGSSESSRGVLNTPMGLFYISQEQGKIFQTSGQGLINITNTGMKWWFNKYLPSQLLAAFPEIEDCPQIIDNPVTAAGCQTVYDTNNDIVYFSKRDWNVSEQYTNSPCIEYVPCDGFYYNETACSGVAQNITCPDGFTYNPATQMCEKSYTDVPFGPPAPPCEFDIMIVTDASASVNTQNNVASMRNLVTGLTNAFRNSMDLGFTKMGIMAFGTRAWDGVYSQLPLDVQPGNINDALATPQGLTFNDNLISQTDPSAVTPTNPSGIMGGWINSYNVGTGQTIRQGTNVADGLWSGINELFNPANARVGIPKKLVFLYDGFSSVANVNNTCYPFPAPNPFWFVNRPNQLTSPPMCCPTCPPGAGAQSAINAPHVAVPVTPPMVNLGGNSHASFASQGFDDDIIQWLQANVHVNPQYQDSANPNFIGQLEIIPGWLRNNNVPTQDQLDYAQAMAGNDFMTGDPNPFMAGNFQFDNIPGIVADLAEAICPGVTPECGPNCSYNFVTEECDCFEQVDPIYEDVLTYIPFQLDNPTYFQDVSWTVSYDPKAKAWISFHDWHPELTFNSINHFMTSKTVTTEIPQCPPGYSFDPSVGECCITVTDSDPAFVEIDFTESIVTSVDTERSAFSEDLDVFFLNDYSGSTRPAANNTQVFQKQFINTCITLLSGGMDGGSAGTNNVQVGVANWSNNNTAGGNPSDYIVSPLNGNAATVTADVTAIPNNANGAATTYQAALNRLNDASMLGASTATRQVAIFITDADVACQNTANFPPNVEVYAVFASGNAPACGNAWENTINCMPPRGFNGNQGPSVCNVNHFAVDASNYGDVAQLIVDSLVSCNCPPNTVPDTPATIPCDPDPSAPLPQCVSCECPPGYTEVPAGQVCSSFNPPICKRVLCECPPIPVPDPSQATTWFEPGTQCDDLFLAGTPGYINPNPLICNYEYQQCVPANYEVGGIWKHNARNDLYANFYGQDYPWEITLIENSGQVVNTLRSVEYQMESYVYKNFNLPRPQQLIGTDKWHDLDWNFDEAVIFNSEQVSGLLTLDLSPKNNVPLLNQYPIINPPTDIQILYSKEEQKYRFNQFWDITDDRGEFSGIERSIWITRLNGYIKDLNQANLNYNKAELQRKKFRHYYNMLVLRKNVSGDRKMLLKLNNSKMNISFR